MVRARGLKKFDTRVTNRCFSERSCLVYMCKPKGAEVRRMLHVRREACFRGDHSPEAVRAVGAGLSDPYPPRFVSKGTVGEQQCEHNSS